MTAIQTDRLTKIFPGGITAVKDLTLKVDRGQLFGFLGPNGAGKTTTLRLLNGTLRPTSGSSSVLGRDCREEAVRSRGGANPATQPGGCLLRYSREESG